MPPVQAVLFDLDETLFDHRNSSEAWIRALQDRWVPLQTFAMADLYARHHRFLNEIHPSVLAGTVTKEESRVLRMRRLLESAGISPTEPEIRESLALAAPVYRAARRPIAGVPAVLKALRASGLRLGIVTNNEVAEQVDKLAACGLTELVDAVVISQEAGFIKPDPRIFAVALERTGARAETTVMVGDSWEADVQGALASGIRAVWFNRDGRMHAHPEVRELRSFEPVDQALSILLQ
jgi:putative hydrolase of the HAD superfamily